MSSENRLNYSVKEINERLGMIDNMVKSVNGILPTEDGNVKISIRGGSINGSGEYELPYTAKQIEDKLERVENMVVSVNGKAPDKSGNVEVEIKLPPTNISAFNNDVGYITESALDDYAEIDYVDGQHTEALSKIAEHNIATGAHNDIRLLVSELTSRINALANSSDEDLDQMAELVAYIKNNKELIEGITTNKINVADIVNNLTTNVANKPLSAAQGVALKGLIDAVNGNLANYQPKGDYVSVETFEEATGNFEETIKPYYIQLLSNGITDSNGLSINVALSMGKQVFVMRDNTTIASLMGIANNVAYFGGITESQTISVAVFADGTYEIVETELAKKSDIPTKPEDIGAQPVGDYLTEVPSGYATEEFVKNKIAEAELGGEEVDLSGYAQKSELPTKVSQLENDKGYLTQHQDISGKLDASALPTAINTALAQAKASGEFDGKDGVDGQPGKDGYTPQKNIDYFDGKDGYTPQKNVDYFDGQPGKDGVDGAPGTPGVDGITPHIGSNGNWYIGDTDTGKPSRGASGQPGQNGSPGKDGTSATHSWNGTVLTVTSASGTSSADLKGAKGDKGDKGDSIKGDTGSPGADGVSPTVAVSKSGKVTTVSITDKNGTKTATINDGSDGSNGKDGTSVTVKSVSESTADGGSNVVTFSDGKTVTIKNGSKGSTGAKGADGYTPVKGVDYHDGKDGVDGKDGLNATPVTPLFVNTIEECTDTTKPYVLPDGYIYGYIYTEVESQPLFTNKMDGAEIHTDQRYSKSSAAFKAQTGCDAVVFKIPSSGSITIRFRNCGYNQGYPQIYGGTSSTAFTTSFVDNVSGWSTDSNGDQYATFTNSAGCTYVVVMMGTVDVSKAIVTVNEEIEWSAGSKDYAWVNTGHAFVPADYESRILDIEVDVTAQAKQISNLEKKVENIGADESIEAAYDRIKNWNYPIYEGSPVFLLESNKPAMGASEPKTTAGIYAKYDALMAANSHYVTRENCGMASDGTTPIYAYHFKEPNPRSPYQGMWREKKPVILACSGVHQEWAGVYSLYYAMEEITTSTKLLDLRRNVHFVIFPMLNPTAATDAEYKMRNPDGIQVHHNFEVGHGENGAVQGDRYYGGATPLSIPETQYFDAVMNRYKDDLSCVLSCHNNVVDEKYGTSFIWCSCATYFMTNLGNRLAEKMSSAWLEKHGDALVEGIRWANNYALEQAATGTHAFFKEGFTTAQPEWDLRIGWAGISGSGGTEYRHGMKYGVHGINVEVCPRCVLDKNYNAEYTSNVMTMGAETYINFFRTFMAVYDTKDKKDYAPNLPWSE